MGRGSSWVDSDGVKSRLAKKCGLIDADYFNMISEDRNRLQRALDLCSRTVSSCS